ncbi:MAG: DNA polymerase IV [Candidatus Doudnabacteria bacterium]
MKKLQTLPRIMLVDMNSFFASVEQQANPALRGKPLGISNSRLEASCLIGTSKEAKALGIKNGTPLYKARQLCPKILVVESEPEKYREVNRRINRIFGDYTEVLEAYSVDESFLDLRMSKLNPLLIGSQIKKRIRQEVGEWLTCSVGIAENKFMAKLAASMEKPDGLSVLWREHLPEVYKNKKLTDLWGISHGWKNRLEKLGITNPGQLLGYPVANLIALFGKPGYFIWQRVNGLETDSLHSSLRTSWVASEEPKSFGHSWVLNFRTTDRERLKTAVLRLAEKASRRMRAAGFVANGMYLSVALVDGNYLHRSKKLKYRIETGLELYREALDIWKPWQFEQDVMHIAVGFTYLSVKTCQLALWPDKFSTLTATLDRLNDKYGEFTVRSGLLTDTRSFAPDAIAFGK